MDGSNLVKKLNDEAKEENKGSGFNRKDFIDLMIKYKIIGFPKEPIKLSHLDIESNVYVNWRNILSDVGLAGVVAEYVTDFISEIPDGEKINCVIGVPEGATVLATLVQRELARRSPEGSDVNSYCIMRKTPKSHGDPKNRFFVSPPKEGSNVVLLEDVITSGSSAIEAVHRLRATPSINLLGVVCLTNRQECKKYPAGKKFSDLEVPFFSMVKMEEILPLAYQKFQPGEDIGRKIEEEYEIHGDVSIKLVDKLYKS